MPSARPPPAGVSMKAGHFHQAVGAASALFARPARTRHGRAAAAREGADRAGAQHRPEHRRRGSRPPGDLAGPAGGAVLRARAGRLERHRLRDPGLPEARALRDRLRDRPGAPQPPPRDGAAGQGRLLGQRDQARPGRWPGRLSGLYPQDLHRRGLPGLRPQAAGRARGRIRSSPRTTPTRCRPSISWPARTTTPVSTSSSACTAWASRCTTKWSARWRRAS